MGEARAAEISEWIGVADRIVDLGCGRGALLLRLLADRPNAAGLGIDKDPDVIALAGEHAVRAGLADRVRFETGDLAQWQGRADIVLCVGASYAFPSTAQLMTHLGAGEAERVVLGHEFWVEPPNRSLLEMIGPLPVGLDGLVELLGDRSWSVTHSAVSTIEEWDTFEGGWLRGVESVGTPEAAVFAAQRRQEYEHGYRGRLGFAWLLLE